MAVLLLIGLYVAFQRISPLLRGSDCTAAGDGQAVTLGTGQAGIAATIAGVAQRDALPAQAVTVAYAAALQESKLQNLPYGDRDSVGVFQQRPSQGWGPRRELENPVYATSKFFSALAKVPVEALSQRWTVSYVPSGSAFARAAERPLAQRPASALVLADPVFTRTPPRYPAAPPHGLLVKAVVNGQGELLDISIEPAAVDADDPEETARTIADLVLAAVRDAYRAAEVLQQQQMGPFAAAMQGGGMPGMPGGLNLPGGLDLSGLGIGGPAQPGTKGPDEDEDEP